MPTYEYDALNSAGSPMTDVITADTPRDARERLRRRGLHVTRIDVAKELDDNRSNSVFLTAMSNRSARKELIMVTQQFATLLKAGIPLSDGLGALVDQIEGRRLETVFRDLNERVQSGAALATAMEQHADIFSPLYINMVRTGEQSGTLPSVLQRVADFMRKKSRTANKISSAMTYPAVIFFVSVAIGMFLMVKVLPDITGLITQQDMEPNLLTQFYITLSAFLVIWWPVVLLVVGVAAFALWHFLWKTTAGVRIKDGWSMRVPMLGRLVRKGAVARFTSTFAILLQAGIPALDALKIVRDVVGNVWLADIIDDVRQKVHDGADIATPIKKSGLFPPTVGYMIAVGEESGQLEEMLTTISDAYEDEIDTEAQRLTALMEPILILFIAIIVGSIIFAIIDPMMQLTQGR